MNNKKYKIVGHDNLDRDYVSEILICDNLNEYWGKIIIKFLQDQATDHDTYFPKLVTQDYELYVFEP